ncbi:hypothetical protein NE237_003938 [Protea cynaroides]|uniref:Diacylglycerol glucosyltransferase N-terminal domain-containing protein n=1 Tax=Protea cynaroides TaxID=273540 RepID=A0A9Q0KIF8_9MAGN|nr:hypothetical protein NE237_003938 [Protea cynaroides]
MADGTHSQQLDDFVNLLGENLMRNGKQLDSIHSSLTELSRLMASMEEKIDRSLCLRPFTAPSPPTTGFVTATQTPDSSPSSILTPLSVPVTEPSEVTNPPTISETGISIAPLKKQPPQISSQIARESTTRRNFDSNIFAVQASAPAISDSFQISSFWLRSGGREKGDKLEETIRTQYPEQIYVACELFGGDRRAAASLWISALFLHRQDTHLIPAWPPSDRVSSSLAISFDIAEIIVIKDLWKEYAGWPLNDMERSYRFMVKYGQLWKVIFRGDNFLVKDNSDLNLVTDKLRLVLIDEVDEGSSGTVAEGDDAFAQSDEELQNSLTDFYVRCRVVEVACHLFDRMTERDSMSTGGYGKNGSTDLAGDDPSNTEMSVGLTSPPLLRERPKLGSTTFVIFDQADTPLTATLELSHNADVVEENMRAATFGWLQVFYLFQISWDICCHVFFLKTVFFRCPYSY